MSEYISQEALRFFGIKNVYFIHSGGITVLCKPLVMKKDRWICTCSSEISENGILRLSFTDVYISEKDIPVHTQKTDDILSLTNCHKLIFDAPLPDFLSDRIRMYRKLLVKSEKRKEQRFPIGQENWKKFSLKSPDCTLANLKGSSVPCVIINASMHGALVIGTRSLSFHVGDRLILAADFTDIRAAIPATLVNTESVQDKYWRYSLHFTEPVSLAWLNHLNDLAIKLEEEIDTRP